MLTAARLPVCVKLFYMEYNVYINGLFSDTASVVASTYYASFPVDVVVYFHMQPSTFRFSCQPISRVECMLRLPSLDVVFSSKRADDDEYVLSMNDYLWNGPLCFVN